MARVRLRHDVEGRYEADILGWEAHSSSPESGPLAELGRHNVDELQFLHDEIFADESYLQGGIVLREHAVIFDVGANIGIFSLFAAARCPSAQIHAFEPVAAVRERLQRNTERHGAPVVLHPVGLSDRDQQVTFNFYPDISIMSCRSDYADLDNETDLVRKYVENARESGADGREKHLARVESLLSREFALAEERCSLRRLSSVLNESPVERVDLLKIDVQRSELDVLRGIDDHHWPLVQQIVMEVHDEAGTPTEGRVGEVRELLTGKGFELAETEVDLLRGAGRYTVQALRPGYARDPRPVVAKAGNSAPLTPQVLWGWLAEGLPEGLMPSRINIVNELPAATTEE